MFERQEKTALAVLVCVVGIVLAVHLLFNAVGRPLFAAPYSEEVADGALVILKGRIETVTETSTGGHLILTVNGTPVFLPQNVAAGLELTKDENVTLYGVVQTYRGKREVVVPSAADLRVLK
jgi:DNA/RNA endonuclease YhcR with UshA esterase domain